MKKLVQALLQKVLGFGNYLFVFAIFKSLFITRDGKEGDFRYLLKSLSDGDHVLDIGANIGIMTTNLARRVKSGHVYAFEPMPENIRTLHKLIRWFRLKNVTVFEHALGNENKEIEMVLPVVSSVKMQGLAHVIDESITEFNEGIRFSVPQKRIDDMPELKGIRIKAIKIDVENFEYQVFLGARDLIFENQPIIYCELWDNENRYNCFRFMQELDYTIQVLKGSKLIPFDKTRHETQNFFFIPKT